ncbi:NACHT and WD repeat domain-containing protein 2 [Mactra antiquata]
MAEKGYKSVLQGKLDDLPSLNSRLVRIFISSTFTDTKEERNVLLEEVYPRLKLYCKENYGMDFQWVDMRWGIPLEASDDHQGTELCLEEIRKCQKVSTGPNFVTFLNQKHGYRPLQVSIPEQEFEYLLESLKELGHDTELVLTWYRKDTNQVPPVYLIQPISTIIPGYKDKDNKEAKQEWENVNDKLRQEFRFASDKCLEQKHISEEDRHKYYMSVTEAEVFNGILHADAVAEHCLCFVRIIEDVTSHLNHEKAWRFVDVLSTEPSSLDMEAQSILSKLRDERIVQKLQNTNINRHTVRWSEKEGINREDHADYLQVFKDSFYTSIVKKIDKAVQNEQSLVTDELYIEVLQHSNMANERCKMFYGREDTLRQISYYYQQQTEEPLVLYGQSGCGKTSIMAQSAKMACKTLTNPIIVLRFLGTSPDSSNLRRLLQSVCQQIIHCYDKNRQSVPEDFDELKTFFHESLKLATKDKPLVVILDSLDQLTRDYNALRLSWLPRKLPDHVSFLISTYTEASELITMLKSMFDANNFIHVPVFSQELSSEVLRSWLTKSCRTLTAEQFSMVESAFIKCSLPLFVKLLYDQVLQWPSYKPIDQCRLSYTVQESIESLFSLLEKKHGRLFVHRSLAYLTASLSGISETELEDLLSLDDEVLTDVFQIHVPPVRRIPPLLWVRVRHDISQYLVEKEVDEVRSFFWYHRQFFETAEKRYLGNAEGKCEVHSMMADYYQGKWYCVEKPFHYTSAQMKKLGITSAESAADRRVSAQPLIFSQSECGTNIRYNKRKLNKLPYHLFNANRLKELRAECLFNYKWNQTKLKAVSLQELLLDLSMCGKQDGILYKAFKASQATLKSHPETLPLELSGRLLALLQTTASPEELKLLDDSMIACAQNCKLVPYQPCFGIPSESEMYTIENAQIPLAPKLSGISSDSSHFATLTSENGVLVWDVGTGELDAALNLLDKDAGTLNVMVKPSRKDFLIVGTTNQMKNNPVFVINLYTSELEQKLNLEKQYLKISFYDDLKFDITDNFLIVMVVKQSCDLFDRNSGKLVHEFEGQPDCAITFADDTMLLLHPKQTNMYMIYRLDNFDFVYQISCIETPKHIYINDAVDTACVVMEKTNILQLIDLTPGPKLGEMAGSIDLSKSKDVKIKNVQMNNGVCLVTVLDGFITVDLKTKKIKHDMRIQEKFRPRHRVIDFPSVLSNNGAYIVGGYDKYIQLYDVQTGKFIHAIEASKSRIVGLNVDQTGEYILTSNSRNNRITCWSLSSLKACPRSYQPLSLSNSARYMAVSQAGSVAVFRSMHSTEFAVLDVETGQKKCEISRDYEAMLPYITTDGKYVVLREYHSDQCLKVWDTSSGNLVKQLNISSINLKAYVLGCKSENMVTVVESDVTAGEHTLTFCKLPSGEETGVKIPYGKYNILQVFFAMNDKYLIIGNEKQHTTGVKIESKCYEVETGAELRMYPDIHPKYVQMITPQSDCFLGQHIHTDDSGKQSWESLVIHIETGETITKLEEVPSFCLSIGSKGNYGIDTCRKVFDLRSGKIIAKFDPKLGEPKKHVPRAVLTADEKYAIWIDFIDGFVKVGDIKNDQTIGMSPIHSIPMNLAITPKSVILIGCEDGRIMMLQLMIQENDLKSKLGHVFNRSMKRTVKAVDSTLASFSMESNKTMMKAKQSMDKLATGVNKEVKKRSQDQSRACEIL